MSAADYKCPVCGTDDPRGWRRCDHPGCPDGRDQGVGMITTLPERTLTHIPTRPPFPTPVKIEPMTSAPKDGTWIIVWFSSGYREPSFACTMAHYDAEYRPKAPWVDYNRDSLSDSQTPLGWSRFLDEKGKS